MLNIATGGGKSLPQMAANAFDLGICEHNLSYLINIKFLKSQKRGKLPSSSCHWLPWSRKLRMRLTYRVFRLESESTQFSVER